MGEEQILLKHHGAPSLLGRNEHVGFRLVQHPAVQHDPTARQGLQAGQCAEEGRLSAAVGSEYRHHFAIGHLELEAFLEGSHFDPQPSLETHALDRAQPPTPQRDQHHDGDGQQGQREGDGHRFVLLQGQVDGEREGLSPPLDVAGKGDGGTELTESPGPGERGSGHQ